MIHITPIHDLFMPILSQFLSRHSAKLANKSRIIRSEVAKATDPTFFDPTVSLGKGLDMTDAGKLVERCVWVPHMVL